MDYLPHPPNPSALPSLGSSPLWTPHPQLSWLLDIDMILKGHWHEKINKTFLTRIYYLPVIDNFEAYEFAWRLRGLQLLTGAHRENQKGEKKEFFLSNPIHVPKVCQWPSSLHCTPIVADARCNRTLLHLGPVHVRNAWTHVWALFLSQEPIPEH